MKDVKHMLHLRELVLAQDILDIAQWEMAHHRAIKLRAVRVVVGEATAVAPERLTSCFKLLTKELFRPDGIKLTIARIPQAGRCRSCYETFFILEDGFVCPKCRSKNIAAISGNELFIKEIEVE